MVHRNVRIEYSTLSAFHTITLVEWEYDVRTIVVVAIGGGRDSGGFYNMMRFTVILPV